MKPETAEKLRAEWRLRNCRTVPCAHRLREAQGDNGDASETYICVRCGDSATVTPTA